MGLLQFIFGKNKKDSKRLSPIKAEDITYFGNIIEIKSLDFLGQYQKSLSGEWLIGWSDSDRKNLRGGYRESGHGSYVLYNLFENKIVAKGALERPNHGHVSDNGYFSLEDWLFGSGLKGTFYVFSPSNEKMIEKSFNANIYNSGLSANGKMAICQTANAPNEHGSILCAFDVTKRKELFLISPPTDWANHYEFSEEDSQLIVVLNGVGKFKYDSNGNFLDAKNYAEARLNCGQYNVILLEAGTRLKDTLGTLELQAVLESILKAKSLCANDKNWLAMALKYEGMVYEQLGDNQKTLSAYQQALKIDPKIGLKRKVDSLLKKASK